MVSRPYSFAKARISGESEITCSRLQGTYLMWLDMHGLGMEHERLVQFCKDAGFGAVSGTAFGEEGRGFMRVNIATPRRASASAKSCGVVTMMAPTSGTRCPKVS